MVDWITMRRMFMLISYEIRLSKRGRESVVEFA